MDQSDTAIEFISRWTANPQKHRSMVETMKLCSLGMIGSGRSSIAQIAELARANLRDGLPAEAVAAFASLGAGGQYPANQERDLHRWLRQLYGLKLESCRVFMDLYDS